MGPPLSFSAKSDPLSTQFILHYAADNVITPLQSYSYRRFRFEPHLPGLQIFQNISTTAILSHTQELAFQVKNEYSLWNYYGTTSRIRKRQVEQLSKISLGHFPADWVKVGTGGRTFRDHILAWG